jgi:hypothetical protein
MTSGRLLTQVALNGMVVEIYRGRSVNGKMM